MLSSLFPVGTFNIAGQYVSVLSDVENNKHVLQEVNIIFDNYFVSVMCINCVRKNFQFSFQIDLIFMLREGN